MRLSLTFWYFVAVRGSAVVGTTISMAALITAITQQDWRIALGGFVQGYVWAWVRRRKRRAHGADRASCGTDMLARGRGAGDTWPPLQIGHFVFEVGLRPPCSAEQPRVRSPRSPAHAFVPCWASQKNKPATFKYPVWSFMGDLRMVRPENQWGRAFDRPRPDQCARTPRMPRSTVVRRRDGTLPHLVF